MAVYDFARNYRPVTIEAPSESALRRAQVEGVKAQTAAQKAETELTKQDIEYNRATGSSRAKREQEKIELQKADLLKQLGELNHKIQVESNAEDKRQWEVLKEIGAVVSQRDPEEAAILWPNMLKISGLYEELEAQGWGQYDPLIAEGLGKLALSNDPWDPTNVTAMFPDGTRDVVPVNKNRPEEAMRQVQEYRNRGAQVFVTTSVGNTGTPEDFASFLQKSNQANTALMEAEQAASQILDLTTKLIQDVENLSELQVGVPGKALRAFEQFVAPIADFPKFLQKFTGDPDGGEIELPNGQVVSDAQWLESKLATLAGDSVAAQRDLLVLAYAESRLDDPGGRLSDRDIENKMIGLGGSKAQKRAALRSIQDNAIARIQFMYQQREMPVPKIMQDRIDQALQARQRSGTQNTVRNQVSDEVRQLTDLVLQNQATPEQIRRYLEITEDL